MMKNGYSQKKITIPIYNSEDERDFIGLKSETYENMKIV